MEMNASSTVGSAASLEQLGTQTTKETNNEKPNTAQEKSPSPPSSDEVRLSSTGIGLSRAEASEESSTESSPEQGQEATQAAEASRTQNTEEPTGNSSPEELANKAAELIANNSSAAIAAQANVTSSDAASLFSA